VFALLSVVSSYHDTLLGRRLTKSLSLPPHPFTGPSPTSSTDETASTSAPRVVPLLPPPSEHMRYTRYWTDRSPIYKRASRALSTLTYLELLMEMLARRKGNDRIRWRVILVIEAIKYVTHPHSLQQSPGANTQDMPPNDYTRNYPPSSPYPRRSPA
jgi:peroxin-16